MSADPNQKEARGHEGPAAHLSGLMLDGGWRVLERLERNPDSTGGYFSIGYFAERRLSASGGELDRAFVKALDLSAWREMSEDLPIAIARMTEAFIFERRVIEECAGRRMANIVRGIAHGQVEVGEGPFATVSYLILELAEDDIRGSLDALIEMDHFWALCILHNVANGLRQLHGAGICHQDLKPSNVLRFPDSAKIGDLGRSFWLAQSSPHDGASVPGDVHYAPPECLYGLHENDQPLRSRAIDAYHLGSMVRFMFTKVSATGALLASLDPAFYPRHWSGTFQEILPHLREAFDLALDDFEKRLPAHLRADLMVLVRQLCDPDPTIRGIPKEKSRTVRRYSMEFYVSRLDLVSKRARIRALTAR